MPRANFAGITGRVRAPPKSPDPAVGGLCAGGCRPPPPPWAVTAALPSPGSGAPRAGEEGRPPPPAGCQAGTAAPPRGAVPGAPGGGGEGAEGGEPGAGPGNPIAGFFLVLFFFFFFLMSVFPPPLLLLLLLLSHSPSRGPGRPFKQENPSSSNGHTSPSRRPAKSSQHPTCVPASVSRRSAGGREEGGAWPGGWNSGRPAAVGTSSELRSPPSLIGPGTAEVRAAGRVEQVSTQRGPDGTGRDGGRRPPPGRGWGSRGCAWGPPGRPCPRAGLGEAAAAKVSRNSCDFTY